MTYKSFVNLMTNASHIFNSKCTSKNEIRKKMFNVQYHRLKNKITLILGALIFVSCDPGLVNNYVIENNSDFSVVEKSKLVYKEQSIYSPDTVQIKQIKPGYEIEFDNYGEIGNAYDKNEMFLEAFDTLAVTLNGMDLSEKIMERKKWKYRVIKQGLTTLDEVEYKLVLQNEDTLLRHR